MNHLTDEQWIEYQYGEGNERAEMERHLTECKECAAQAQDLSRDLAALAPPQFEAGAIPERNPAYAEHVWDALQASLTPYTARRRGFFIGWRLGLGLALAGAASALMVAFYSGRLWEKKRSNEIAVTNPAQTGAQGSQSVILLVIGDHLDRSQRLLAELDDPDAAAKDPQLQRTARELLTENRLYRVSAARAANPTGAKESATQDDDSFRTILEDLEPVLVELANQPDVLDRKTILRVRREMNTGGLLFEIHVLRSRVRTGRTGESAAQKDGAA